MNISKDEMRKELEPYLEGFLLGAKPSSEKFRLDEEVYYYDFLTDEVFKCEYHYTIGTYISSVFRNREDCEKFAESQKKLFSKVDELVAETIAEQLGEFAHVDDLGLGGSCEYKNPNYEESLYTRVKRIMEEN